MPDAVLEPFGQRARLRFERELAAAPSEVWRALTDPEELAAWFPCQVIAEGWTAGATLRFVFPTGGVPELSGTVLEAHEPRLLSFTWGTETLRFELSPSGRGTLLVMTDELDRPIAARNAAGWEGCLDRLAGRVPADDAWKARFDGYAAAFEPVLGAQEGPPAGRG
jgi:uncharacterized protein YndB with AHSA1/START domain